MNHTFMVITYKQGSFWSSNISSFLITKCILYQVSLQKCILVIWKKDYQIAVIMIIESDPSTLLRNNKFHLWLYKKLLVLDTLVTNISLHHCEMPSAVSGNSCIECRLICKFICVEHNILEYNNHRENSVFLILLFIEF